MTNDGSGAVEGLIESSCVYNFHYEWKVKNFSLLEDELYSPVFEVVLFGDLTKWMLNLVPNNYEVNSDKESCGVYLHLAHTNLIHLVVDCEFTLWNSDQKKIEVKSLGKIEYKKGSSWGFRDFIKRDLLLKNISHDNNLWIASKIAVSQSRSPVPQFMVPIAEDIYRIYATGDFCDVTFTVHDKKFPAHKVILAARSPVFSAMFKIEMKETISGEVEIEDMKPEVFEEFLKYIYGGETAFTDRFIARDLLAAADKYDIVDLKDSCEEFFIQELSRENCVDTLVLAELFSAENLKRKARDFIISEGRKLDKNSLSKIKDVNLLQELLFASLKIRFDE